MLEVVAEYYVQALARKLTRQAERRSRVAMAKKARKAGGAAAHHR
jgi:hypothetical protein